MKPEKYAHLHLKLLPAEYKYVLFESRQQLATAQSVLLEACKDFCAFSFQGESSLICTTEAFVEGVKVQEGWIGVKIIGDMPFGTVQGLIANISGTLYSDGVGVCLISTYLSDLFFIRRENLELARSALKKEGWGNLE